MARLAGVDLPREKRVEIGLTYIYGIGLPTSQKILKEAGVNPDTRVKDLTDDEVANIRKAKQSIKKAFEVQLNGLGLGFVEILSTCPTNWRMTPEQAHARVREEMMKHYIPGVYKDITEAK